MNNNNDTDQNDAFHVDMTAIVDLKPADAESSDAANCFPELHALALMSETSNIDDELTALTDRIKDITLKKSVSLLHKKLNIITSLIDIKTAQQKNSPPQSINMSEANCRLIKPKGFNIGQRVAIAIIFTPSYFTHFSFAKVSQAKAVDESRLEYLFEFENLTEAQKQQLIKHMFRAQTSGQS